MASEVLVLNGNTVPVLHVGGGYGWALSVAREAAASASLGDWGVLFAGGWITVPKPCATAVVDAYNMVTGKSHAWNLEGPVSDETYWIGGASYDNETAFLADSTHMYKVTPAVFAGEAQAEATPLPETVSGIPAARMARNGVRVGSSVCFYSAGTTSLLACYNVT